MKEISINFKTNDLKLIYINLTFFKINKQSLLNKYYFVINFSNIYKDLITILVKIFINYISLIFTFFSICFL